MVVAAKAVDTAGDADTLTRDGSDAGELEHATNHTQQTPTVSPAKRQEYGPNADRKPLLACNGQLAAPTLLFVKVVQPALVAEEAQRLVDERESTHQRAGVRSVETHKPRHEPTWSKPT